MFCELAVKTAHLDALLATEAQHQPLHSHLGLHNTNSS